MKLETIVMYHEMEVQCHGARPYIPISQNKESHYPEIHVHEGGGGYVGQITYLWTFD